MKLEEIYQFLLLLRINMEVNHHSYAISMKSRLNHHFLIHLKLNIDTSKPLVWILFHFYEKHNQTHHFLIHLKSNMQTKYHFYSIVYEKYKETNTFIG